MATINRQKKLHSLEEETKRRGNNKNTLRMRDMRHFDGIYLLRF